MIEGIFKTHYQTIDFCPKDFITLQSTKVLVLEVKPEKDYNQVICAKIPEHLRNTDVEDIWYDATYKQYWSNPQYGYLCGLATREFYEV